MSRHAAGLRGRSAKIVATLGPGSSAPGTIRLLAEAGVDVFRLNFSHGEQEKHKQTFEFIRQTEALLGRPLAVLADMQGPKIRVGKFPEGELQLEMRGEYDLVVGQETDATNTIPVPRAEILSVLEVGDTILADDGLLIFTVIEAGDKPRVRSELPGVLKDRKGFTVRGKALPVPALSEKDRSDLAFAIEMGVDIIALSFVQTVEDIEEARALIGDKAMIVAKLEKPAAIENLDEIIAATDSVMIARGDLGVEFPPEEVPLIQRKIVRVARNAGKPVIVATQMLESMVENAAPTRAEASDVATISENIRVCRIRCEVRAAPMGLCLHAQTQLTAKRAWEKPSLVGCADNKRRQGRIRLTRPQAVVVGDSGARVGQPGCAFDLNLTVEPGLLRVIVVQQIGVVIHGFDVKPQVPLVAEVKFSFAKDVAALRA